MGTRVASLCSAVAHDASCSIVTNFSTIIIKVTRRYSSREIHVDTHSCASTTGTRLHGLAKHVTQCCDIGVADCQLASCRVCACSPCCGCAAHSKSSSRWICMRFKNSKHPVLSLYRVRVDKPLPPVRFITMTASSIVCIVAAACLTFLPPDRKWGRLIAYWFTAFQVSQ